jgi:putative salt-induced outer membrane protein
MSLPRSPHKQRARAGLAAAGCLIAATAMALPITASAQGGGGPPPGGPPEPPPVTGSDFLRGSTAAERMFSVRVLPTERTERGWRGQAKLGFSAASGNSDTANFNAGVLAVYNAWPWRHTLNLTGNVSESNNERTTERYGGAYKLDWFFRRRTFAFLFLGADHDKFADIDLRYSGVLGLGHQLLHSDNHSLVAELGVGARQTEYISDLDDQTDTVGHFSLQYVGKFGDNVNIVQDVLVQAGSNNTYTESVTALQVALTELLALSVSFTVSNNSDTPPGIESTDTFTAINLVATY